MLTCGEHANPRISEDSRRARRLKAEPLMARNPRPVFPGAVYHVMARGVRKSPIFIDDVDRRKYLRLLACAVKTYACLCYVYCLMGNHYHLVIKTPRGNFSRFSQYLNGEYAKYFNRRHKYSGHVYDGRCKSPLIEDNEYLASAIAYVLRNPIEAQLVTKAGQWKWSSYQATVGNCSCPEFLTLDWLPRVFMTKTVEAACRRLAAHVHATDNDYDIDAEIVRGSARFHQHARKVIGRTLYKMRVPRSFRALGRPGLDELFAGVKKADRRKIILRAQIAHGYLLSEIARYLDLHPTTISRIVHRKGKYR
jgi:putative transposase